MFPQLTGTVKHFDESKGFGFINADDRRDDFVHISQVQGQLIRAGDRVSYRREKKDPSGRMHATNVAGGTGRPVAKAKGYGKGKDNRSEIIRPSNDYDTKLEEREYGGDSKKNRDEARQVQYQERLMHRAESTEFIQDLLDPRVGGLSELQGIDKHVLQPLIEHVKERRRRTNVDGLWLTSRKTNVDGLWLTGRDKQCIIIDEMLLWTEIPLPDRIHLEQEGGLRVRSSKGRRVGDRIEWETDEEPWRLLLTRRHELFKDLGLD